MDRWTAAGLLLTEWDRHRVAIKQWWDLNVTWLSGKKTPNIKYFLIRPPSCSRVEQNGSIVLWGLLKAEPAQGKGGCTSLSMNTAPNPAGALANAQFGPRASPWPAILHSITLSYKSHVPVGVSASA